MTPNRVVIFSMVVSLYACQQDPSAFTSNSFNQKFKQPEVITPLDNPLTKTSIELGRYLFFNSSLSNDRMISCASCHNPDISFSDDVSLSIGSNKQLGTTNSPSLANIAFHPYFTRAGGVPSLEQQILVPIQEHNEFNSNLLDIAERLKSDSYFVQLADKAYPNKPYYFALTASIASFERTLISNKSKFDKYLKGDAQLTNMESAGMSLFFSSKTNCGTCHSGFNFTDYSFQNNFATRLTPESDRSIITKNKLDVGKYKVPSLRNIAITAPYMHDGSLNTLDEVLDSYNKGGNHSANMKNPIIKPLNLTPLEINQLKAFLESLTDFDFIQNPNFKKP